jgi:hypothetical protein
MRLSGFSGFPDLSRKPVFLGKQKQPMAVFS